MSERWAATCDGTSTVMAGPGAWPLLALLATAATGPGRDELATAVGLDAAAAAGAGAELLALLDDADAVRCALGLWTRRDLDLDPSWSPPAGTRGTLTGEPADDQRRLDAWAAEKTDGLIQEIPTRVTRDTRLVLASALTARTAWADPFDGDTVLSRTTHDLRALVAGTPNGPVTMACVAGVEDIDVHLVQGDQPPGQVLAAAFGTLEGRHPVTNADDLPEGTTGPGVTVWFEEAWSPRASLRLTLPAFTVTASHDLLDLPDVFGLDTVTDQTRGHFPGIGAFPLAIGQAGQNALARFDAEGFEAAAVTSFGMLAGSAPPTETYRARRVAVTFEAPFGFLAVHRPSGLVLTTGWVDRSAAA
ncbi:proteinase inhibitor I4 serpin [Actinomadura darangshiensis]|uniref:Proteinase inhibitor I4 serpin n=2 Tax=Actinomadura darangshiensis TaxID=705336 RepID=A0A4R5ADS6_9ACTN|nr:proteinase inhibitor I4 serpin [Actinomadura darangshiensis]